MSRLFDPKDKTGRYPFDYVPSANTDLRERFRKVREQLDAEKRAKDAKVKPIRRETK